ELTDSCAGERFTAAGDTEERTRLHTREVRRRVSVAMLQHWKSTLENRELARAKLICVHELLHGEVERVHTRLPGAGDRDVALALTLLDLHSELGDLRVDLVHLLLELSDDCRFLGRSGL